MMFAGPIALALLTAHPGLYYEPGDLGMYQAQATGARSEVAQTLKAGAASLSGSSPSDLTFEPDRGAALVGLSVSCMLSADPTICQTAHRWVTQAMAMVDPGGAWEAAPDFVQANYLMGFGIAYDVLSDARLPSPLTSSEHAQLQALIAAGCAYFYNLSTAGQLWYSPEWEGNHNWSSYGLFGVAALSILGEVPAAQTWLNHAIADYGSIEVILNRIVDGTWHEGYSYQGGSVAAWLWFTAAVHHAKQMGRLDASVQDFTQTPWLQAFGHYRALGSLPGRTYESVLTHGDFYGYSSDEAVLALRYAAARFDDHDAAWLAQTQLGDMPHSSYAPEQNSTALEYLVMDPTVAPTQPVATDLYLSDLAGYITRSGYDANAAVLGLKAGAFGGLANWNAYATGAAPGGYLEFGHDHVDDLGFWFYANGQWLAPEAAGYVEHPTPNPAYPLAYNTVFHNTLSVDGVGQLGDNNWASEETNSPLIDFTRKGAVVANVALPAFSYAEMEGAHLYPASLGLDTVRRQVLFINRQTVVVRDQLHSSTTHTFEWNSHAMDGASASGDWIEGIGKNGQALGVRVLSPAGWTFSSDEQTPQEINVPFDPDGNITHFVVASPPRSQSTRFLIAMEPTTVSGWSARPDIQPLGTAGAGLILSDGTQWVFGDAPNSITTAAGLTLVGTVGAFQSSASGARYALVRANSLQQNGSEVLSADAIEGAIDAQVSGTRLDIQASLVTRARVLASGVTQATWNGAAVTVSVDPADSRHLFVPGMSSPPMDAGTPPGLDAGNPGVVDGGHTVSTSDAGWPLTAHDGGNSSVPPVLGSGGPGGTVRGHCDAAGTGPWALAFLALMGLSSRRRKAVALKGQATSADRRPG